MTIAFQVIASCPAYSAVERQDLIPLGEDLGFPVYQWKDNSIPTKAIIVAFHGMTFYGLAFEDMASHFASEGYPVYSYDFRGFGFWRKSHDKYKNIDGKVHFSQATEDGKKLIKALHAQYPGQKIFCIGESLGSNLALWAVSQESLPVDGLILCGLAVKNSYHPTPRWVLDFAREITNPNRPMNLTPYVKPNLASDPKVTNIYLKDPEIVHKLSSVELVKALITNKKSIESTYLISPSISFLIISGENDRMFKASALPDFATKLGEERTTVKILPKKGHLLLELAPMDNELSSTIDTWLDDQIQIKQTQVEKKEFEDEGAMQTKPNTVSLLQ